MATHFSPNQQMATERKRELERVAGVHRVDIQGHVIYDVIKRRRDTDGKVKERS
jgi:hypothetical protein